VEDGGALDAPQPVNELAVLQHGQPVDEVPARAPQHALPAAAPSWWLMDEEQTGKEEVPLFKLSCRQDWQGTIHTIVQVYSRDTHDI